MEKRIADLFGIPAPDHAVLEVRESGENTPSADPAYIFDPLLLKKILLWLSGQTPCKNLLLIGDAGVGKTSLLLEVAARLGRQVWSVSCSGRTRFADLVGTLVIDESGATRFVDGPLTAAMRAGELFLGNEITRMDAGEQMRLVDVLDGRSRLTIPETGEVVIPHADFRFAATGNSGGYGDESGAYAGEKVGSLAFGDRFIRIWMTGLSEEQEKEMVLKSIPGFDEKLVEGMVRLARDVRKNFIGNGGGLRITISPRSLLRWCQLTMAYSAMSGINSALEEALMDSVLNGSPEDDHKTVIELLRNWMKE
jgi:cobaltochelatase CobS